MVHDSARLGAIGWPGIGFTTASCSAYSIMNGVITDGVSAGSNHVGASETWTANVTSPSAAITGGAATGASAADSRSAAATPRRNAERRARRLTTSPPREQATKHRAVLKSVAVRGRRRALLQSLAHRLTRRHVESGQLALVAHERGDLPLDAVGDVDDDVRLIGAPVPELA